jgi:hypothetical protein
VTVVDQNLFERAPDAVLLGEIKAAAGTYRKDNKG